MRVRESAVGMSGSVVPRRQAMLSLCIAGRVVAADRDRKPMRNVMPGVRDRIENP